jgi:hypothetical protein
MASISKKFRGSGTKLKKLPTKVKGSIKAKMRMIMMLNNRDLLGLLR